MTLWISPVDLLQVSSLGHYEDHMWGILLPFITAVQGRLSFRVVNLLSFIPPALRDMLLPVGSVSVSSSLFPHSLYQSLLSYWDSVFCIWPTESRRRGRDGGSCSVACINNRFSLVFCPMCQSTLLFATHKGWWRKVAEGQQNWIYFFGKPWVIKLINLHVMNGGWIIVCRIYLPVW